ncbi:twin-arginine translocase TatA/TatE family subunit [Pseudolysinimonas yzui]|uniref:Sec-independent protein translocase protein TatA n=1 Tax=Pseudolysinimonas yzui TaxID=2708254 RepID=A0A8J3DYL0_9MICO|nr:twin-arginine translocase TatA/TatE family subunit [Pseudolysinimonas yzui]GHF05312.1 sec-independent protein translocase protein TatA [Pseudolysinimonas yzui]
MLGNLSGWHLLIVLAVVLLLFGATRLPNLAKGVGQSLRIFRSEMKAGDAPDGSDSAEPAPAATDTPVSRR